jgi:putative YhdH/YhfP family quinone oxidoreductase
MTVLPDRFRALIAEKRDDTVDVGVRDLDESDLPDGDVTIRVSWTSVNYKDALAVQPKGRVAAIDPLVPGIDLAGEVVAGEAGGVAPGDQVLVHGYDLGVAHHGGFAEYARVPAQWVVPLPEGLSARQAMALGTAGFTAGLSVQRLQHHGLRPGTGPVLVTGATGGVGSTAVGILAELGYEVVASSGKPESADWLRSLGASEVIDRAAVIGDDSKPLARRRWAGAVDCVGGQTLAGVVRSLDYAAGVAVSGNTGGAALQTTVLPMILRGVSLLGIDSVHCPHGLRMAVWHRLAGDLRPRGLDESIAVEVNGLGDELVATLDRIGKGAMQGRAVVRVGG